MTLLFVLFTGCKEESEKFNGLDLNMGNLCLMSDAKSRSISPENFTGEKGRGGMATLEEGNAAEAARDLGQGWKVNPYIHIEPGEEFVLADIEGEGAIQHFWITSSVERWMILRMYWDDETEPSVEVPVSDFFAAGWGPKNAPSIQSLAICVNPRTGYNSYWQMPFRKRARITLENLADRTMDIYYQVDYTLTDVPDHAAYFHARWNRVHHLPHKEVYTIVDNIRGKGQYVGTYLAHGTYRTGWWGEGEIKFYMDGDTDFPTICGTGEEDYFCGSYNYADYFDKNEVRQYKEFDSPYTGFHYFKDNPEISFETKIGQYRWHILDPIRFENDMKVTIQSLGWQTDSLGRKYQCLQDDMASVAYWYQEEPHQTFPDLPPIEQLIVNKENPNPMK
ncbi:MAG: glycoside hydrolase family 172 protein [Bacteroidota bacterium]